MENEKLIENKNVSEIVNLYINNDLPRLRVDPNVRGHRPYEKQKLNKKQTKKRKAAKAAKKKRKLNRK